MVIRSIRSTISEGGLVHSGGGSGAGNRFTVIRAGETLEPSPVPGKVGGFRDYFSQEQVQELEALVALGRDQLLPEISAELAAGSR